MQRARVFILLCTSTISTTVMLAPLSAGIPLPTAFTYQGQLKQNGQPYTGSCDISVELWTDPDETDPLIGLIDTLVFAAQPGSQPVEVQNGLFQLELEFGPVFEDDNLWLQLIVDCPSGTGAPVALTPRTKITRIPQALFARESATAQRVPGIDGHSLDAVDGTPTDAVFVDSNGRVGIGTVTPDAELHFRSTSSIQIRLEADTDNSGEADQPSLIMSQDGGVITGSIGFFNSQNQMSVRTNDTGVGVSHLLLLPEGNVGLGTASNLSTGKLIVGQELDSADSGIAIFDAGGDQSMRLWVDSNDVRRIDGGASGQANVAINGAGTGRVGIQTTSPDNTLHVFKGSAGAATGQGNAPLIIENSTNAYVNILTPSANESGVLFGNPNNNSAGGIIYNSAPTPNGLQLRTNGNVTRAVIDSTGNMGIGTAAPSSRLHLVGPSPDIAIKMRSGGSWTAGIRLSDGSILSMFNGSGETERLSVTSAGNVGIGTTSPAATLDVNGNVIIRGNLTQSLRTCTVRYTPFDLNPASSSTSFSRNADALSVPSSAAGQNTTFGVGMHFPNGAVITALRAQVNDSSPTEEIYVRLRRRVAEGPIASAATVSIPGIVTISDTSINHTVDHTDSLHKYMAEVNWQEPGVGLGDISLLWVEVDYQTTEPCPGR